MVKERCKTKWQDKGSCTLMSVYFDHRLFHSNINRCIKMERNSVHDMLSTELDIETSRPRYEY